MDTIDKEASKNKSLIIDFDQFKDFYITENGYFRFPSFSVWSLEKNLFFLLSSCKKQILDSKYFYRPDYLSYDEYGTPVLWPIILFVNSCFSREEFCMQEVLIPTLDSIIAVCRDKISVVNQSEDIEVDL